MSLIAVNIPTLWLLRKKMLPEIWLQRLRSILSLSSTESRRSSDATRRDDELAITKKVTAAVTTRHADSTSVLQETPSERDLEAYPLESYATRKA